VFGIEKRSDSGKVEGIPGQGETKAVIPNMT